MTDIFRFPEIENGRGRITMMSTPRPPWDGKQIQQALDAFDIKEQSRQDDTGPRLVIRGVASELEIFRTSDSIRWTELTDRKKEPDEPVDLPPDALAQQLADRFLAQRGLRDDHAAVASVTHSHHSRIGPGNKVLANYPVAKHVNYRFRLDGLPVFGPGAKIQVTFDGPDRPSRAYKFWRRPTAGDLLETIGYERAAEQVRNHRTFKTMREAGKAKVIFNRARLGYYALPARELQSALIPAYRFEGATHGPDGENYRFTRHVVAVALTREEVKRRRWPGRLAPPAVFSA